MTETVNDSETAQAIAQRERVKRMYERKIQIVEAVQGFSVEGKTLDAALVPYEQRHYGDPRLVTVRESSGPDIGYVWYRPDVDGRLEIWKANYDSSG